MENKLFFRGASGQPELTLRSCCSRFALVTILSLLVSLFVVPTLMVGATGSSDYVMTYCEDTPFGLRYIPELTDWSLEANPAMQTFMTKVQDALAEQDANIADILGESDAEEWGGGASDQSAIFSTYISYHDDLLSLVVRYTPLTPGEPYQYHMFSLNLDLTDGAELSLEDVLSRGDCTLDDVEFSIREISRQCMERDSDRMALVNGALESRMPDFASLGYDDGIVENTLDYCVNNFRAAVQGYENDYGIVPDAPAFVCNELNQVYVSAGVGAWYGSYNTMIPVVKSSEEATALAFQDLFGEELIGHSIFLPETAWDAVKTSFGLDEQGVNADGDLFYLSSEGMAQLPWEEFDEGPCYVFDAYVEPAHNLYKTRYISSSSGAILDYDAANNRWDYVAEDFHPYAGDPVADSRDHDAAGLIISRLNAYEAWLSQPYFVANGEAGTNFPSASYSAEDMLMCLVTVAEPHSVVTVEYGNSNREWGAKDNIIYTRELHAGQSLLVMYSSLGDHQVGVRVTNEKDEAFFNLSDLQYEPERVVYLKYDLPLTQP